MTIPEYDVWWRVEVKRAGHWHADDDHDTPEQADRRKEQLESHGETVRVRKMRGTAE